MRSRRGLYNKEWEDYVDLEKAHSIVASEVSYEEVHPPMQFNHHTKDTDRDKLKEYLAAVDLPTLKEAYKSLNYRKDAEHYLLELQTEQYKQVLEERDRAESMWKDYQSKYEKLKDEKLHQLEDYRVLLAEKMAREAKEEADEDKDINDKLYTIAITKARNEKLADLQH